MALTIPSIYPAVCGGSVHRETSASMPMKLRTDSRYARANQAAVQRMSPIEKATGGVWTMERIDAFQAEENALVRSRARVLS